MTARGAALALVLVGCTSTTTNSLPAPIPLQLGGGALTATATVDDGAAFPVVLSTGSPLTAYDDGRPGTHTHAGRFTLFDAEPSPVPRLRINDVVLFTTPLGALGAGDGFDVGGVLGGDNLSRFALGLDYRGAPTLTLLSELLPCSCEVSRNGAAVFGVSLAGGGNDRPLTVDGNAYTYPASRILLDVCLEPIADPLPDQSCQARVAEGGQILIGNPAYLPSGVEVKLLVDTGFPGLLLSSSAFDRLRGAGSAGAALASGGSLHVPDPSADPLAVGTATLGRAGVSALAIVSREGYFGPCGELARSRRLRHAPPGVGTDVDRNCRLGPRENCPGIDSPNDACDDENPASTIAAVVELTAPVPAYVASDSTALLVGANADVRPQNATVDGIIGTEVLSRLVTTLDYPGHRVIARCASADGCRAYKRYLDPQGGLDTNTGCANDALCEPRVSVPFVPDGGVPDAGPPWNGLCPPADPR